MHLSLVKNATSVKKIIYFLSLCNRYICLCFSYSPDSVSPWHMAEKNIQAAHHVVVLVKQFQDVTVDAVAALPPKMKKGTYLTPGISTRHAS